MIAALTMVLGLGALSTGAGPATVTAGLPPARPHLVLVVGAAGAPEYNERFHTAARHWQKAAARGGASVTTIGLDDAGKGPGPSPGKTASNIRSDRQALQQALATAAPMQGGPLWLVLIGHGTFDGRLARFNLRGADATEKDLAAWLAPLRRPLVFINTASASAPFLRTLAGPDRVLITATRSGNEVNAPRFGTRLAEALTDLRADLDRDGGVSLLEAFLHASKRVETAYTEEGLLATEHALLEDNGDGVGTQSDAYRGLAPADASGQAARDGARARLVSLLPPPPERQLPEPLRRRRDQLEGEVLSLRERRATLPESTYYARLEKILYEIARLYQRADRQRPAAATAPASSNSPGNTK